MRLVDANFRPLAVNTDIVGGNLTDAHLAALDADFDRFPGVRPARPS